MAKGKLTLLYEFPCKLCGKHFLYCIKSGRDFRCNSCKERFGTLAQVKKELEQMSEEEKAEFLKEIREYEYEHKTKIYDEDE